MQTFATNGTEGPQMVADTLTESLRGTHVDTDTLLDSHGRKKWLQTFVPRDVACTIIF